MKKIILSIMAVSALFACRKEALVETPQAETVTFTAFVDGADTKTVLDGESLNTKWSGEEWIQIVGTQAYWFGSENVTTPSLSTTFSYNGGNGEYTETGAVMAVYPAGSTPYTADLDTKTVGVLNVPSKQYPKAGSFDPNAAIAVTYTENSTLLFKNAVALLKFTMGAENITAACIYANDGGDISGTFSAKMTDGVPVLTGVTEGEGNGVSQWVDFYPGEGSAFEKGSVYYVAIAPTTFPNGFGISFGDKEVKKYESSATFKRNVIYNMGTIGTDADSGDPIIPWAVAGTFNEWSKTANPMTLENGYYVARNIKGLNYTAPKDGTASETGIKFVNNGTTLRGGEGQVTVGTWAYIWGSNDSNIYVNGATAETAYDIYLNPEEGEYGKFVIVAAGAAMPEDKVADPETLEWAIVGSMPESNWSTNIAMTLEGDWRVAKNVDIRPSDEFKFRVGTGWDKMVTYNESAVVAGTEYNTVDGTGMAKGITVSASAKYDVYLYKDASKFKLVKKGDLAAKDYSQCVIEIVGAGVADQTGATKETIWNWGNSMLASNNGKPSVSGNTYTWTWTGIQLANAGCKIRTKDAAASGGIANFDCGASTVDESNSVAVTTDNDGNIIVAAGKYNITFTIDAATDTKKIVIKAAN